MKARSLICLAIVVAISLGTYLATLQTHPPGLTNDETDIGYEAYSIIETGRDQWGNFLPLGYFSGFGGTRLPLIIYWTAPFIKLFGLNPQAVRLAGAMAGLFTVIGVLLLLQRFFSPIFSIITTLVLVFTPWFWGLTRTTNEAVLALGLTVWGIYTLILGQNRHRLILVSAIFFGLSIYTYYSSQVFVPLFLLALALGLSWLRHGNWRTKLISITILIVMIIPLGLKTLNGSGSATRLQQTGLFNNVALVGELNAKRGDCLLLAPNWWCRANYNRPTMWLREITNNYLSHFSLTFLFGDNWFVGILPSGKLFFLTLLIGLIGSFYGLVKSKIPGGQLWLSWLVLAPVADSLTGNGHGMRAFLMVPPLVIICVAGWKIILLEIRPIAFKRLAIAVLFATFLLELAGFLTTYGAYFPKRNSVYSHYPYRPLINYLLSVESNHPQIYLSNDSKSIMQYSFYLFYSRYDPGSFQKGANVVWEREPDGWIWVKQIGKWHFVKSLPSLLNVPEDSLLIGNKDEIENVNRPRKIYLIGSNLLKLQEINRINLLSGDTAFVVSKVTTTLPSQSVLFMLGDNEGTNETNK